MLKPKIFDLSLEDLCIYITDIDIKILNTLVSKDISLYEYGPSARWLIRYSMAIRAYIKLNDININSLNTYDFLRKARQHKVEVYQLLSTSKGKEWLNKQFELLKDNLTPRGLLF